MNRRLAVGLVLVAAACAGQAAPSTNAEANLAPSATGTTIASTQGTSSVTSSAAVSTITTRPQNDVEDACRPDPFAEGIQRELADTYSGKQITAHVYDVRTGCEYRLNPGSRQQTASVFKIIVMAGTLLEGQEQGRPPSDWEMSQMTPMITESANSPVRALWRSFGSSPWFRTQGELFGLDDTSVSGDGGAAWGGTRTSAEDQVDLVRQVLLGEWGPLSSASRRVARDLMTSVVPGQTWGITAGVPDEWKVAQKNGFAGSIVNSVGWVDEPGVGEGYVVAILTRGWPSQSAGVAAVEKINLLVVGAMIDGVAGAE